MISSSPPVFKIDLNKIKVVLKLITHNSPRNSGLYVIKSHPVILYLQWTGLQTPQSKTTTIFLLFSAVILLRQNPNLPGIIGPF